MESQSAYTAQECRLMVGAYLGVVHAALNYSKEKTKSSKEDLAAHCKHFKKVVPTNVDFSTIRYLNFLHDDALEVIAASMKL